MTTISCRPFWRTASTLVDILHGKKNLSLGRGLGSGQLPQRCVPLGHRLYPGRGVGGRDRGLYRPEPTRSATGTRAPICTPQRMPPPLRPCWPRWGTASSTTRRTRYKQQRLVAFSNWPTTDPFLYPADITNFFMKCAQVDVEHIQIHRRLSIRASLPPTTSTPITRIICNYVLNPGGIGDDRPRPGQTEPCSTAVSQLLGRAL